MTAEKPAAAGGAAIELHDVHEAFAANRVLCGVDLEVPQQRRHVVVRSFGEFQQPMLDFDVIVRAREAEPGRACQGPGARVVELAD